MLLRVVRTCSLFVGSLLKVMLMHSECSWSEILLKVSHQIKKQSSRHCDLEYDYNSIGSAAVCDFGL